MAHNDTELITIATNRTSNASTVSVKEAAANAAQLNSRKESSLEYNTDNTNLQKIDCKLYECFFFTNYY